MPVRIRGQRLRGSKNGVKVALHQPTHTLCLDEVVIHGVGAETEGAQENAPLHLRAEPLATCLRVQVVICAAAVVGTLAARAVPDAVVFGEVRRGFCGRENVVGGQRELGGGEADGTDDVALLLQMF
jgi:hypothetical protein